jgi:F420-non-reducing hydrogenase iron-sulfur subunit
VLAQFGLENRVRMEWVSASEGARFAAILTDMVSEIKKLGPNPLKEELL